MDIYAVVLASVASVALGYLWYSKWVLGKQYARSMGKTPARFEKEKRRTGPALEFILSLLTSVIMAAILTRLADMSEIHTLAEGMILSLYIWMGFVVVVIGSQVLHEGRHLNYFTITAGHRLVELLLMGAIIGAIG